jgi:hypothetical protein
MMGIGIDPLFLQFLQFLATPPHEVVQILGLHWGFHVHLR